MIWNIIFFLKQNIICYESEKTTARKIQRVKENVESTKTESQGHKQSGKTEREGSEEIGNTTHLPFYFYTDCKQF